MRISDWSSDVCSSDLREVEEIFDLHAVVPGFRVSIFAELGIIFEIPGRISVDNIVAIARTADEVESRRPVDRPDVKESVGPRYQRRDRKSTRLNSSPSCAARMPSSA